MKAKEVTTDTQELLDTLESIKNKRMRDPAMLNYTVSKEGAKAHKNILRPVGMFTSCRAHWIGQYVMEGEEVPYQVICIGRNQCPVCKVVSMLYDIGTEDAKKQASRLRAGERNFWNVIPRWEYEWGDKDPGCRVLPFGTRVREQLEEVVADYGHPGDIEEGFDMVFEASEQSGGQWGKKYKFYPKKKRAKKAGKVIETTPSTPLTDEELEYDMVDLAKFTDPPTAQIIEKLEEIFDVKTVGKKKKKRRRDIEEEEEDEDIEDVDLEDEEDNDWESEEDEDDDEDEDEESDDFDEEEDEDEFLCFGKSKLFNPRSKTCIECDEFQECKEAVKKEMRRKRQRNRK